MRRGLFVAALGVLSAVLLGACGSSSSNNSNTVSLANTNTVTKECKRKPVTGGSVIYARQLETVTLNPREIKNGNGDIFADEMLYTGLVRNDPNGEAKIVPGLAEKWEMSSNGTTYTFHLRPNLKYSDGSPISAEDIAWNIRQFINPKVNTSLAVLAVGVETAKAVNNTTVQVTLKHPIAAFLYDIAVYPAFVVSREKLEKEGAAFWKHPVGTGPFRLKEFATGSHITFERNPYWIEPGKPYLQSMRWNFTTNSATRMLDLKSNEAQLVDGVPFNQIETVKGESGLTLQLAKLPQEALLVLNTKVPALKDVHARRALNYALNRPQMLAAIFKGVGNIPNSMLMNFEMDASQQEVKPLEYSVTKAKEEMAASSTPHGFSVSLQYPAGSEYYKQLALLVQQEWAAIGVTVKLIELESATVSEKWFAGEFQTTFPFVGTSSDIPVPDEYSSFYALPEAELHAFNSNWTNAKIEQLDKEFISTSSNEKRKQQWKVLMEEFNKEVPSLNVMDYPLVNAHQSNICGTTNNALGVDQMQETWIAPS